MMLNGWSPGGCVTMDFGGLYWLFNLVRSLGPCFHVVLFTRHGSGGDKLAGFNSFLMVMDAVKFRDCLGWPGLHSSTSLLCKFGNVTPWPLEETDDLIKLSPEASFFYSVTSSVATKEVFVLISYLGKETNNRCEWMMRKNIIRSEPLAD